MFLFFIKRNINLFRQHKSENDTDTENIESVPLGSLRNVWNMQKLDNSGLLSHTLMTSHKIGQGENKLENIRHLGYISYSDLKIIEVPNAKNVIKA